MNKLQQQSACTMMIVRIVRITVAQDPYFYAKIKHKSRWIAVRHALIMDHPLPTKGANEYNI
ncbi:hypothetical protein [Williamwhitmania taraxaci]|nr:hypothetical protein [Williamwhitmania taraxaci]